MFERGNQYGKGRKKGSKNLNTSKIRDAYQKLIEDALPQLQDDLLSLDPKDRLRMIVDLSAYVIPKMRSIEGTITSNDVDMMPVQIHFTRDD